LLEKLEVDLTAVVEQLLAEIAEFEVDELGGLALRLQVDLHNQRADLAIEVGVGVLNLSLTEDGLNHDLKDFLVNLESIRLGLLKAFLREELAVTNEHGADLCHLTVHVVWCDLVELQANLLDVVL